MATDYTTVRILVPIIGLEPIKTTAFKTADCADLSLGQIGIIFGRTGGTRTHTPLRTRTSKDRKAANYITVPYILVAPVGLEPTHCGLSGHCFAEV